MASANHSFRCLLQRKISVNFRTADDGGAKPEKSRGAPFRLPYPAYPSVISAQMRRASIGQKAIAGCFSEDSLRNYMLKSHASKTGYIFNKSAAFFGDGLRRNRRANYFHHVQASQDELAEPYKYSNTFSSTSTPLWRIEPLRVVPPKILQDFAGLLRGV
jgi:hypothetical protein